MADARDLTYGVGFQASDALNAIEQMESGLGDVDEAVDRAEAGAQSCSRAISDTGAARADALELSPSPRPFRRPAPSASQSFTRP